MSLGSDKKQKRSKGHFGKQKMVGGLFNYSQGIYFVSGVSEMRQHRG